MCYERQEKPHPRVFCGCGRPAVCLRSCFSKKYYVWCMKCQREDCFDSEPVDAAVKYVERYGGEVQVREDKNSEWKTKIKVQV